MMSACGNTSDQVAYSDAQLAKTQKNVALIYDYNPGKTHLEFRAVKLQQASGDPLKDAIQAFLQETQLSGEYDSMDLDQKITEDEITKFIFSGKPQYGSSQDSSLFFQALDMTIARHHNNLEYQIFMLDQ